MYKSQLLDSQSDIILPQVVAKLGAVAVHKPQLIDNQLDIILQQPVAKLAQDSISPQAAAKLGAVAAFSFQPEWKGMMIEYYYQSTSCFLGKIFCKSAFMCRPYRAQGLITSYPGRREP